MKVLFLLKKLPAFKLLLAAFAFTQLTRLLNSTEGQIL